MEIVNIIMQIILAFMFTVSASVKFRKTASMVEHWHAYRYPMWFMNVIATLETLGVIGMITGIWIPEMVKYTAALLVILMAGAIHAHLFRAKHKLYMAMNAFVMLCLSIWLLTFSYFI